MKRALAPLAVAAMLAGAARADVVMASPSGGVRGILSVAGGRTCVAVRRAGKTVVEASPVGITVDGVDLGSGVTIGAVTSRAVDETYPILGKHATGRGRCVAYRVVVKRGAVEYAIEARAYDDGLAYRYVVPGGGVRRVGGESSSWTLPAGARAWYFERESDWKLKSYAGTYVSAPVEELETVSKQGPVQGAPLVAELPGDGGYVAITEAALYGYSGMRLRAMGDRRVRADFTEGAAGFEVSGEIVTPWRVTLACPDLDGLVNSDVITSLNPPPDPALFADTSYIKPGRAVWRFLSRRTGTPEQEREFVDYAVRLGFEYTLVDEGWETWAEPLRSLAGLCAYAKGKGIGVLVWKRYSDVSEPRDGYGRLAAWLDGVKSAGVAGVKIDFMNAESLDRIRFQTAALRLGAERKLLVIFHGCQKPTGEERTWPNGITREAVRGLELNHMEEGPVLPEHNAALPFTRYLAGPADYTPLGYQAPGATSWTHQLATTILFTSPILVIAEDPAMLLNDPRTAAALDVTKALPAAWDETRVLPMSRIGGLAVMARRKGETWFVAGITGKLDRTVNVAMGFLGGGTYRATVLTSPVDREFVRQDVAGMTRASRLEFGLRGGDGFVVRLVRE